MNRMAEAAGNVQMIEKAGRLTLQKPVNAAGHVFRFSSNAICPAAMRAVGVHGGDPTFGGVAFYFFKRVETLDFEDATKLVQRFQA